MNQNNFRLLLIRLKGKFPVLWLAQVTSQLFPYLFLLLNSLRNLLAFHMRYLLQIIDNINFYLWKAMILLVFFPYLKFAKLISCLTLSPKTFQRFLVSRPFFQIRVKVLIIIDKLNLNFYQVNQFNQYFCNNVQLRHNPNQYLVDVVLSILNSKFYKLFQLSFSFFQRSFARFKNFIAKLSPLYCL